jgi:hypothetical protein
MLPSTACAARGLGLDPLDQRVALFERFAHHVELRVQIADVLSLRTNLGFQRHVARQRGLGRGLRVGLLLLLFRAQRHPVRLEFPDPLLLALDLPEQVFLARRVQPDAFGDLALQRRQALRALADRRLAVAEHRVEDVAPAFQRLQVLAETLSLRPRLRQIGLERAQPPCLRLPLLETGAGRSIVRQNRRMCSRRLLACGLQVRAQRVALRGRGRVIARDVAFCDSSSAMRRSRSPTSRSNIDSCSLLRLSSCSSSRRLVVRLPRFCSSWPRLSVTEARSERSAPISASRRLCWSRCCSSVGSSPAAPSAARALDEPRTVVVARAAPGAIHESVAVSGSSTPMTLEAPGRIGSSAVSSSQP